MKKDRSYSAWGNSPGPIAAFCLLILIYSGFKLFGILDTRTNIHPSARHYSVECDSATVNSSREWTSESNESDLNRVLFDYMERVECCCRNLVQYGGVMFFNDRIDGDKFICQQAPFKLVPNHCLVYSFGISYEWSFDNELAELGCEVHAFDPSMDHVNSRKKHGNITFHKLGVLGSGAAVDSDWKLVSLEDIIEKLGHTGRRIDYLKMDIEGGEWGFLEMSSAHLQPVKQMGMELHLSLTSESSHRYSKLLRSVHSAGFRLVHSHPNRVDTRRFQPGGVDHPVALMNEVVWVNTKYIED